MIAWWWLLVAAWIGFVAGMVTLAMMQVAASTERT